MKRPAARRPPGPSQVRAVPAVRRKGPSRSKSSRIDGLPDFNFQNPQGLWCSLKATAARPRPGASSPDSSRWPRDRSRWRPRPRLGGWVGATSSSNDLSR
jgi:hypothetical protein